MGTERIWIPLEENRVTESEIVFANSLDGASGEYRLESSPVFAAIGYGDIVTVRHIEDFDAWLAGEEEHSDPEDSRPLVTSLRTRSNRVTLMFSVVGSAKAKVLDEISAGLGQQCLNSGADGEGVGDATGLVCVPEQFSQTHGQAWRWLLEQLASLTPNLSRGARSALEKDKAWLAVYFADVPEMSTQVVPGLRRKNDEREDRQRRGDYEDPDSPFARAEALMEAGKEEDGLRILEHSAYDGNPASLVHFMMHTIANGQPGWALAADFWFDVGGYWDDCPTGLNPYIWEDEIDEWRQTTTVLQSVARLQAADPRNEPQALSILGAQALARGQHHLARGVLLRAAKSGLTPAMTASLWLDGTIGDPGESLKVFESVHYPQSPDPFFPLLTSNPIFEDWFVELASALKPSGKDDRLQVISNAGVAYALSGNPIRAIELWQEAQEFAQARWWHAVLLAHQGDMEGAVDRARSVIRPEDWDSLEEALTISDQLPEDQLRSEYVAWMETSKALYDRLES